MSVLVYACRNCQGALFKIVDTLAGSLMDIQMAPKETVYMSVNERETKPFLYDTGINPLNNESQWAERVGEMNAEIVNYLQNITFE